MEKKTLKAITDIVDGKMLAVASDDSVDRMGDSLTIDKWDLKDFKRNPVLLPGHESKPQYVIGVAKDIRVEGNKLLFEPVFHSITELARDIGMMFEKGILKAWSVGFIPNALMEPENKKAKNELLEISAVAVPANANALTTAKSYDDKTKKEIEDWVDSRDVKKPVSIETSETDGHKHLANINDETGDGETTVAGDDPHAHSVKDSKIAETNGHTHSLKKPKKKTVDKKEVKEVVEKEIVEKEVVEKEGKVISKKNKEIIQSAVEITKQAVEALEKLLELSETPKEPKAVDTKVEETKVVKKELFSEKKMITQVLKKIAGNSNLALNKLNKT